MNMPRVCTICSSPKRQMIERAILNGEPVRDIERRTDLSRPSIQRHKSHISRTMAKAADARELAHADNLVEQLGQLTADALRIGKKAEKARQYGAAMGGVREMARIVELIAR